MSDFSGAPPPATPWQRFTRSQRQGNTSFTTRLQQDQLAESITYTTTAGKDLVAEAPTGVGKSYAALVPTIERARRTGKPVVIATPSKSLQAQYFTKDIPAVAEHVGPVEAGLLFGRNNYVCLSQLREGADLPEWRIEQIEAALPADGNLVTGLPDDLELTTTEKTEITTTSDECPGARSCPFGDVCHYEQAKTQAQDADVVVTNTSMLIAAALSGPGRVLPEWSSLVVDEAHKLPDVTIEALGWNWRVSAARRVVNTLQNVLSDDQVGNNIVGLTEAVVEALQPKPGPFEGETRRLTAGDIAPVVPVLADLAVALAQANQDLDSAEKHALWLFNSTDTEDERQIVRRTLDELTAAGRQVDTQLGHVRDLIYLRDDQAVVLWSETSGRTAKIAYRPLNVAPFLSDRLWSQAPAVLMSATIPADLPRTVGLESAATLQVDSPFNLAGQSRRYVADITPQTKPRSPGRDEWLDRLADEVRQLVTAAGGRALVLFASYGDLDAVHDRIEWDLTRKGITVLRQQRGADAERHHLVHRFKADETSVLLGVASFEEGLDVPGDALQLVIITRVPNATPDEPIFAKRVELAGGGWSGYKRVNGPAVAVRMAQAAGRLIRTDTDAGMVAVLDGRVRSKAKTAVAKLPDVPTFHQLTDATTYLTELRGRGRPDNVIPLRQKGA